MPYNTKPKTITKNRYGHDSTINLKFNYPNKPPILTKSNPPSPPLPFSGLFRRLLSLGKQAIIFNVEMS